ncbi:ABC transporter G family member 20-like [Papaver somniferum]|uniref:ABC transporter G family member 20-like n=1 Tax=Papaver somniferum TaxID=3469 RepID=UPI000E6F692F|nr:ABC transporter G family member 20-like [Papaver somniferum]
MGEREINALGFHVGIELEETSSMSLDDDLEEVSMMTKKTPVASSVLAFNNLTYSVNTSKEWRFRGILGRKDTEAVTSTRAKRKMLLNNISGEAREGEILAILGPSGSGKSTLIDALANRISKESLGGSVTLNGETLESGVLKMISAYVMQDDLLYPILTVEETLMFSADFRLPHSLSKGKKMERVQTVIDELGLRNAAKTIIGDEDHRGISGGERRRVSIGANVIRDPILLFLDEPTSGLNSSCAFMVVKVLQRIARSGRIVIMSVHQPSSRVVSLLDQLIFLSLGETVYYGSPFNLSPFLSEYGHCVPENEDTTEFMLDLYRELEDVPGGTRSMVEFNQEWYKKRNHPSNSEYSTTRLDESLKEVIPRGKLIYSDIGLTSFANPFWFDTVVLVKRSLRNSNRMPEVIMNQIGIALFLACFLGSLFWHLEQTEQGVQELIAFFAFMVTTIFFCCTDILAVCIQDRHIFIRETAYNAYHRSSYALYRSIIDIPIVLIVSIILASITFWSVGLEGGYSGFLFYFLVVFTAF